MHYWWNIMGLAEVLVSVFQPFGVRIVMGLSKDKITKTSLNSIMRHMMLKWTWDFYMNLLVSG